MRNKLLSVLHIILCERIANEVERMYEESRISHEQIEVFFKNKTALTETVPDAFPEGKFTEFLENTYNSGIFSKFIYLNPELISAKDLAYYYLGYENELPSDLKVIEFFNENAEFLIQNSMDDFLEKMKHE